MDTLCTFERSWTSIYAWRKVKLLFLSLIFEKHVDEQGGSNDLNHIKIDQRKGVALDDFISYWSSIESAKRIGIKTTTIS